MNNKLSISSLWLDNDFEKMETFLLITKNLPTEIKLRIFKIAMSNFYQIDMLPYLKNPVNLPLLNCFFKDFLLSEGKLYFGGFNEFDLILLNDEKKFEVLNDLIVNDKLIINTLKIFDLYSTSDDLLKNFLIKSNIIWCANEIAFKKIFEIYPLSLNKITDLSIENLNIFKKLNNVEINTIFGNYLIKLTDFTLPIKFEDLNIVKNIFKNLKLNPLNLNKASSLSVTNKIFVHLPLSYPMDEYSDDLNIFQNLQVISNITLKPQFILFALLGLTHHLNNMEDFIDKIGYENFSDLCIVSIPEINLKGNLNFVKKMKELVTIVLSGKVNVSDKTFGNLSNLTKLKELMFENCFVSFKWLNDNLPLSLKDITIKYDSMNPDSIFCVPSTLKILTILAGNRTELVMKDIDFSKSNLHIIKFRIDENDDDTNNTNGTDGNNDNNNDTNNTNGTNGTNDNNSDTYDDYGHYANYDNDGNNNGHVNKNTNKLKIFNIHLLNLPANLREVNFYRLTDFIVEKDIRLRSPKLIKGNIIVNEWPEYLNYIHLKSNIDLEFKESLNNTIIGNIKGIEGFGGIPRRLIDLSLDS